MPRTPSWSAWQFHVHILILSNLIIIRQNLSNSAFLIRKKELSEKQ